MVLSPACSDREGPYAIEGTARPQDRAAGRVREVGCRRQRGRRTLVPPRRPRRRFLRTCWSLWRHASLSSLVHRRSMARTIHNRQERCDRAQGWWAGSESDGPDRVHCRCAAQLNRSLVRTMSTLESLRLDHCDSKVHAVLRSGAPLWYVHSPHHMNGVGYVARRPSNLARICFRNAVEQTACALQVIAILLRTQLSPRTGSAWSSRSGTGMRSSALRRLLSRGQQVVHEWTPDGLNRRRPAGLLTEAGCRREEVSRPLGLLVGRMPGIASNRNLGSGAW